MVIEILLFNACIVVVPLGCWQQLYSSLVYVMFCGKIPLMPLFLF